MPSADAPGSSRRPHCGHGSGHRGAAAAQAADGGDRLLLLAGPGEFRTDGRVPSTSQVNPKWRVGPSAHDHTSSLRADQDLRGVGAEVKTGAGIICGILAVIVAVIFGVRVGTLVERNTSVFTSFDNCIAKAGDRTEVSSCIARFSTDIQP